MVVCLHGISKFFAILYKMWYCSPLNYEMVNRPIAHRQSVAVLHLLIQVYTWLAGGTSVYNR